MILTDDAGDDDDRDGKRIERKESKRQAELHTQWMYVWLNKHIYTYIHSIESIQNTPDTLIKSLVTATHTTYIRKYTYKSHTIFDNKPRQTNRSLESE